MGSRDEYFVSEVHDGNVVVGTLDSNRRQVIRTERFPLPKPRATGAEETGKIGRHEEQAV